MALKTGTQAPEFTLFTKTATGLESVTLSQALSDSHVVLLFFPAAFTGVCTAELCDQSQGLHKYTALNCKVFGISCDSPFAQEAWSLDKGIMIPLLSDYKREVTAAYDVVLPDLAGLGPACKRAAFVVHQNGTIIYSEETATPKELPDFEAVQKAMESL